ncbi:MAG: signal peptidase II [Deltaproteobacteria bacterium]|nr:signal peptidase II [Deltaproteobacteria bacterium]
MPRSGASLRLETSALAGDVALGGTLPRSFRRLCAALGSITLPIVALDQLSKIYVASHLPLYGTRAVIPNWLDITYTLNPGAAFSLFATMPAAARDIFFLALSVIATVVLLVLIARPSTSVSSRAGFALILGGTLGNFIDRLVRGRVVDFIYFHHDAFSYPVFNVADSAITVGVATILVVSFLGEGAQNPSRT